MPRNKIIDAGVVTILATVLIWVGAELTRRVEWILPWSAAAGVILLLVGVVVGLNRRRR